MVKLPWSSRVLEVGFIKYANPNPWVCILIRPILQTPDPVGPQSIEHKEDDYMWNYVDLQVLINQVDIISYLSKMSSLIP